MLELRGSGTLFPRIFLWFGVLLIPPVAYAVWGALDDLQHPIGLGIAGFGVLVCGGSLVGALWRLRHPDSKLIIDKEGQTLAGWSYGEERFKLRFDELGVMSVEKRRIPVYRKNGGRKFADELVVGLSAHPHAVLYVPDTNKDMVRFAVTLRDVIGEQYLPKAAKRVS